VDIALNTIIMATKVKITYTNSEGNKEELKKTFFGKEHMERYLSDKGINPDNIDYIY